MNKKSVVISFLAIAVLLAVGTALIGGTYLVAQWAMNRLEGAEAAAANLNVPPPEEDVDDSRSIPYPDEPPAALPALDLESAVVRNCELRHDEVYLEPQGFELVELFVEQRKQWLPEGATLPPPHEVMGLPVVLVHRSDVGIAPCIETDEAFIKAFQTRDQGPVDADVRVLGKGAWLVLTTPIKQRAAASSLVSPTFLKRFHTKGPLAAFVLTDNAMAYADSSDPAALRLATSTLAEIPPDDSFTTGKPLLLKGGSWKPWTPPHHVDLSALTQVSDAHLTQFSLQVLQGMHDLVSLEDWRSLGRTAPPELDGDWWEAERTPDSNGVIRVTVDAEMGRVQVVGLSPMVSVRLDGAPVEDVEWKEFASRAGDALKPFTVAGHVVPHVYSLSTFEWTPAAPPKTTTP